MPNSSLAFHSEYEGRRSTRVNQAIRVAVKGMDSLTGPYHEEVSTITVSCHGCLYESKYAVTRDAFVILKLRGNGQQSKPISTRGRVKWTQRPTEPGHMFRTAIELDAPLNIWGIDAPPDDWLTFPNPHGSESHTAAVPRAATVEHPHKGPSSLDAQFAPPSGGTGSAAQLAGIFQQQMEKVLSEAAETVVRERTATLLDEVRIELREEAKRLVAEANTSKIESLVDESLTKINQRSEECAKTRHAEWAKRIETDLDQALARMDLHHRELEENSTRLLTSTQDQLQSFLEASRKDSVDRIIARLKEQSTPVIEHARRATQELMERGEELEKLCLKHVQRTAAEAEESCARLNQQFEMMLRERIDSYREELDITSGSAAKSALASFRDSAHQHEAEATVRLRETMEPVTQDAIASLKEKAADISRQFASELSNYSRSHLEFVGGAITDLAKGIGKLSNS